MGWLFYKLTTGPSLDAWVRIEARDRKGLESQGRAWPCWRAQDATLGVGIEQVLADATRAATADRCRAAAQEFSP